MAWVAPQSLIGKHAVVTGANRGVGYHIAKGLAAAGAEVTMICRNEDKANQAIEKISQELDLVKRNPGGSTIPKNGPKEVLADNIVFNKPVEADLASFKSIRGASEEMLSRGKKIDILINNAGIVQFEGPLQLTEDGYETQFAVNHIAPFMLTAGAMPLLRKKSDPNSLLDSSGSSSSSLEPSRVITMGSLSAWVARKQLVDLDLGIKKEMAAVQARDFAKEDQTSGKVPESQENDLPGSKDEVKPDAGSSSNKSQQEENSKKKPNEPEHPFIQYITSKSFNLMFTAGLHQRVYEKHGIVAVTSHPGGSDTEIFPSAKYRPSFLQPAWDGAQPAIRAATDKTPEVIKPNSFWGNRYNFFCVAAFGLPPAEAWMPPGGKDQATIDRLWQMTEVITDIGPEVWQ